MTNEERKAALEAIIYAADEPATIEQLLNALSEDKIAVQYSLDELVASYATDERGIEVRAVAGGYKMYTKPQHHDVVRRFIKSRCARRCVSRCPRWKLSRSSLTSNPSRPLKFPKFVA